MNKNLLSSNLSNKHVDRRSFLKTLSVYAGGSLFLPFLKCAEKNRNNSTNFIIILVDDLGWTDLACYGSRYYETPNIDRLAAGGMRFTNAYAACAVCSPTRAAVMTGRYPARIGVTDWIRPWYDSIRKKYPPGNSPGYVGDSTNKLLCPRNPYWMELDELTLAEALKPAGYTTCHIGKWHLGDKEWFPDKQGFDKNIGGCDLGAPPSYFDPYYKEKKGAIPTLKPRKEGEYLTDRESDEAVRFIRQNKDNPFFLYLAHYAVHAPIQAKDSISAKYKLKQTTNQRNPTYAAMIQSVDESVGRITSTLDNLGLTENTVIIFASDNGGLSTILRLDGPTDNSPLRSGKGYPYEGGIRVPLIIRWKNIIKAGTLSDEPVNSIDYFPTILSIAGLDLPGDRVIDGMNLLPILTKSGHLDREALFWHFPHYRYRDVVPYSIIRAGEWKLIKRYEGKAFELYNLNDDIEEKFDLSEKMKDKVNNLDLKLTDWLKSAGAKMPMENPEYKPGSKKNN